ncbi:unnamed protein product, partial [Timema podura]|nr:unnamed protein product [Timema podura]
ISIHYFFQTIRPHVPLIKFRKGGLSASDMLILIFVGCLNCEVATHASDPRGGTTASDPSSGGGQASQKRAGTVVRTVKEHELPWRLQRKDIDEAEMAYINLSVLILILKFNIGVVQTEDSRARLLN